MAEIMGTVTSVKRYLSPEKIELKISPDLGGESTIILQQNRKYIIPDFQREIRWEENNSFFISTTKKTVQPYIPNSSDETTIKGLVEQLESSIMTKDIMYAQKEVKKLNNLLSGQNKVLSEDDAIRLQNTLDKAYFLKKENSEVATEYFISVRSWIARCQNRADISKATPHTS